MSGSMWTDVHLVPTPLHVVHKGVDPGCLSGVKIPVSFLQFLDGTHEAGAEQPYLVSADSTTSSPALSFTGSLQIES